MTNNLSKMQKKVLFYCQHSMGIGHLVRSFALANSLKKYFKVILISGGEFPEGIKVPKDINFIQLPPIGYDANNLLIPIGTDIPLYEVMKIRKKNILDIFINSEPDFFITEHFPFGKILFMGELLPILKYIKVNNIDVKVICSSRDILEPKTVKKEMLENFSIKILNHYYSKILVHGDENFISLDQTFPKFKNIKIPISYTGYISNKKYVSKINRDNFEEIVLSAGGGKVASLFINKMISSFNKYGFGKNIILRVIVGPIFPNNDWLKLQDLVKSNTNIILIRSVESLSETWKKAKLSISPGGYNTTIETLCSRIPALIVPYCNDSNSEQKIRTTRLKKEGLVEMLHLENTSELQIAHAVNKALCFNPIDKKINLNGADNTVLILQKLS
tara:strand:- start:9825 stop:10991 length:1167 start_codon:yes stop_codon:yes gene_type:complete